MGRGRWPPASEHRSLRRHHPPELAHQGDRHPVGSPPRALHGAEGARPRASRITIAVHDESAGRYQRITEPAHHQGLPLVPAGPPSPRRLHLHLGAPEVEVRPLAGYELQNDRGQP